MKMRYFFLPAVLLVLFITMCGDPPKHLYRISDSRGAVGFIDIDGKVIVEPQYQHAGKFIDGVALLRKGGLFGFMNSEGKLIVPLRHPYARDFSEGLAVVGSGSFMNTSVENRYDYPPYTFQGTFGYIDRSGKLVIPYKFGLAGEFSEGMAVIGEGSLLYEYRKVRGCKPYTVKRSGFNGKFGYIDRSGKVVIPPSFDEAHQFSNGLALVKTNGRYRYIDRKGKTVWHQRQ
jgi:hypothetical protein